MIKKLQRSYCRLRQSYRIKPKRWYEPTTIEAAKYELKQYKEAIADYDKAIELNPKDADTYYNRGAAKNHLKQHKEAIADYDKAIELDPKDADAYYNRGSKK